MITIAIMMSAALQAAVAAGPRKEYVACLKTAVTEALKTKMPADQFNAFAHQHCTAIETQFRAELTKFGMKNGMSKAAASDDAQMQLDDYVFSASDNYADQLTNGVR